MKTALLAALLLVACGPAPDLTPVPGQGVFSVIVWNDAYGETTKAPAIEWRRDLVDCGDGEGLGYWHAGVCKRGNWSRGDEFVTVAYLPDFHDRTFWYAHEALHVHLARAGHDDPEHQSAEWTIVGLLGKAVSMSGEAGW